MDEEDIWEPKPMGKDFATTEEVSEVAGVERASLYEWVREGLLPAPRTTGGRGIIAKWPLATLKIAPRARHPAGDGQEKRRSRKKRPRKKQPRKKQPSAGPGGSSPWRPAGVRSRRRCSIAGPWRRTPRTAPSRTT
jgi:excisionase family DNA binding protein